MVSGRLGGGSVVGRVLFGGSGVFRWLLMRLNLDGGGGGGV